MRVVNDDGGQAIVVAALLMTMLLGIMGIGVDISWLELNLIRMQRAADAAALAGVVYLPGNPAGAFNAAYAEATKNGFTNGAGGVTVVPRQDLVNNRMLEVSIQGPVQTYFNPNPTLNTAFDPNGYSYIVEFQPGTSGGAVWIFDPIFCATGKKTTTPFQRLGLGDAWYSVASTRNVTTEYKLWDMNGTPYATSDDILVASDGGLFANMDYADKGPDYSGNRDYGPGYNGSGSADCASSPYHNSWWQLASGLSEGQYRLQVVTNGGGLAQQALNTFGIQLTTTLGTGARIYGQSRLSANANLPP